MIDAPEERCSENLKESLEEYPWISPFLLIYRSHFQENYSNTFRKASFENISGQ